MTRIPKLYYISQGDSPEQHIDTIREACTSGIECVELRLNNLDDVTVLKTAQEARDITGMYHTRLMISDDYNLAKTVKADGVYLNTMEASPLVVRAHLYTWQIIGAAAHNLEDCKTLLDKKVDYIGLGPHKLAAKEQHSNSVLGLGEYTTLLEALYTETPIIAFGGIQLEDVSELLKTGIYGIAVSQALTKDFKKTRLFQQLLGGSNTQEQVWNMDDHK